MSSDMTQEQAEEILAGRKKPVRTVNLCLRLDLQDEFDRLEKDLAEAQRRGKESFDGGGDVHEIAAAMEALAEQMRAATVPFRFEPVTRVRWSELILAHPARKDEDGQVVVVDGWGVNTDTFFLELIPESCRFPVLDRRRWVELLTSDLTDGQVQQMMAACWALNARDVDVPFSRRASAISRRSGNGSGRQSG